MKDWRESTESRQSCSNLLRIIRIGSVPPWAVTQEVHTWNPNDPLTSSGSASSKNI